MISTSDFKCCRQIFSAARISLNATARTDPMRKSCSNPVSLGAATPAPPTSDRTLSPFSRFLRARLSPEGYLGLHLTIGASLLLIAGALFGAIADEVARAASITQLDLEIARWLHSRAAEPLTTIMLVLTHLHGVTAILFWSLLFGIYLARRRAWYWVLSLTLAVGGGSLLNVAMKYVFQRARPSFDEPLLTLVTYSFPSGHTAGSTMFYGVLVCYLFSQIRAGLARLLIVASAIVLVLLVGLSRMYLGVHYFSDVLAAIAEGWAWLALSVTAVSTLRRRNLYRAMRSQSALQERVP